MLGAVLYWLLLPLALLAGEWGGRGELGAGTGYVPRSPSQPRRERGRRAGAVRGRRGDCPGRAALGARIPEA